MEFKGTKVKWVKEITKKNKITVKIGNRVIELGTLYEDDCRVASCCKLEENANALLISKAPEMLEMLKKIQAETDPHGNSKRWNEIQQLIKEATEL
jgi:hypothetical protein